MFVVLEETAFEFFLVWKHLHIISTSLVHLACCYPRQPVFFLKVVDFTWPFRETHQLEITYFMA